MRSGSRAQDGGAGDAVGTVTEFSDPRSGVVTPGLVSSTTQIKSPVLRWCSAGVCQLERRFSAGKYSLIRRDQIVLANDSARAMIGLLRWSKSSTPTIDGIAVAWLPIRKC